MSLTFYMVLEIVLNDEYRFFAKKTCPNLVAQDILLYPGIPGSEVQQVLEASFSLQVNNHGNGGKVLRGMQQECVGL